jgi:hypothetical protein
VMDWIFATMSEDPDMGPKLREADVPQRFEFPDMDLVVNIRAARDGEDGNLHWEWSDVAMALARRRIKSGGDVKAALSLIPITKPIYARYREFVEEEHPHLAV